MVRKKRQEEAAGNEWMNTYADLVTLLLCFFIMLFSMSSIKAEEFDALIKSFRKIYGSDLVTEDPNANIEPGDIVVDPNDFMPIDFAHLQEYITEVVKDSGFESEVKIEGNQYVIFIRFNNSLLYDPDSAILKYQAKEFLNVIGDAMIHLNEDIKMIRINGHTASVDNTGGSSKTSDRTLSSERANSVLMYLEDVKKVPPAKLIAIGYGRNYPIADNTSEDGRAQNRRVEIIIMSANTDDIGVDSMFDSLSGDFNIDWYDSPMN